MTKHTIEVPRMGESISEATVGEILIPSGSYVEAKQELMELETDKVNQMLYAPVSGLVQWNVKTGDHVAVGSAMGFIEPAEKPQGAKEAKEAAPAAAPAKEAKAPASSAGVRKTKDDFVKTLSQPPSQEAQAPEKAPEAHAKASAPKDEESFTRIRLSRVRKVIAERMVQSQKTAATLTTFNEVDMSAVMALRAKYKDDFTKKYGVKLGFSSFFIKAAVSALRAFPSLHTFLEGDELLQPQHFDISVAVGTDRGLLVPVIRNCDQLSFAQIEKTLEDLAVRAREGSIKIEELQGGSFTITNGGVYGSLLSTPILNAPQSGILGMHKIEERPVAVNGQVVIRPMMYLAVSYDHRITDGKEAVSFLVHVKNCLEDPARLLLQL